MAGEAYEELGRWELAEKEYLEITRREPENPWGWLLLGGLYGRLGDLDRAAAAYTKVLAAVPRHAPAYTDMAELMILAGRTSEGKNFFKKALAIDPSDQRAIDALGRKQK